jgi:hypothetical protein
VIQVPSTVLRSPGTNRQPTFDEMFEPTRAHRALNQLLSQAEATQAAAAIPVGATVLGNPLSPAYQLRLAGNYAGHAIPLGAPALRLTVPRTDGPLNGSTFEAMSETTGAGSSPRTSDF